MKQIARDCIPTKCDTPTFHDKFQEVLDMLNQKGTRFNIEEYYNNTFTTYIVNDKIYTFRTKECKNSSGSLVIIGTINELDNMNELYKFMLRKRSLLDKFEIRQIYNEIENKYNSIKERS